MENSYSPPNKVGLVYDPIYLEHDTGNHVETSHRLIEIMSLLKNGGIPERTISIPPRPASIDELLAAHSEKHIAHVKQVGQRGGWLDADTIMSTSSYNTALYAAGGLIEAVDAVWRGDVNSTFALIRPPGHHATQERAMGFCLFNNVAVAAKHALNKTDRVLIADFDVHHGNGTQDIFYDDPRVLYFSIHQYPHYPGTGSIEETGTGAGEGTTVNAPLPGGCGDEEYIHLFNEILIPIAERFKPGLIMVSAGYDPHWADPLSSMQVTTTGFVTLARILNELAGTLCQGKIIFTLEGGYDLAAISQSIRATMDMLLGKAESKIDDPLGKPTLGNIPVNIEPLLHLMRQKHGLCSMI